ncbi:carbohydrate ABC transporter permease [Alicyclobacillus vulcanalis]|uniref:carbohydrate ABC transporter permease n=1 Tax=Alicyclobacillus vulcanalis TaxID=252246 RepID=UPI003898F8F3
MFFEGLPAELFESARIDGCTDFGILIRIIFPLSLPVFITATVLMFINIWGDYLWPDIVLPNYKLLTVSPGLETFLGSFGATGHGQGAAFAANVLAMAPIVIFLVLTMRYFVNGVTSGAVKG